MNRKLKVVFIILGIVIVLVLLILFDVLSSLNTPINEFIAGTPDKSCNIDSDCTLKETTCELCDCGDVVNQNWERFCPFVSLKKVQCKICASLTNDFDIKCVDNLCQKNYKK